MKKKLFLIAVLFCLFTVPIFSQVIIPNENVLSHLPDKKVPRYSTKREYSSNGFLPGKNFPFYSTIDEYNFNGLPVRVELKDNRYELNLSYINCSDTPITNNSEFKDSRSIHTVKNYIEKIFKEANINIDSLSRSTLEVSLDALDGRLLGFGYIKVHGLCQMTFKYMNVERTYCIDIVDGDKNAPLGNNDFVTRKTAMQYMLSASIREVIEQFLNDLNILYSSSIIKDSFPEN